MDPLPSLEESLRQSQQIIRSILDTIPVRVFWKDRELKYLGCNRPFAEDAGFHEPKDLVGKDDYAMGWRDQAEIYRADDRSVIESGIAKVMIEEPQKTPDGRIIWLLTSKVPLRDANGRISGVLGTYMDISEYRNAKEAIRESEEKYRAFFATSKDVVFITSKDGRFVDFNDGAPAFFGFCDREEFGRVRVQDLYSKISEREGHIRVIEQAGFVKDYPVDLRKKDGSIIHALVTSTARKDISGNIIGFQGTIKDITEAKQAEEEIAFKNVILSTQQETSLDGILIVGESGILNYNHKFIELWGIPDDLIATRSDERLLQFVVGHLADPDEFFSRVRYLYEHTEERSFEEILFSDGRVLERFSAPMLGEKGKYYGRVWYFRDITDRKQAEKALKESNERYLSYIKEAAMRLKTPVEVVERNITSIIRDIHEGDIEKEHILLELQLQVKNMEQIRQNILDLNKTIVDGYGEISPASKKFLTE